MSGEDLIHASRNGDITEVEKLIDQGAPVNSEERSSAGAPAQLVRYQDEQGNTALMMAAMRMKSEIISALLQAGADVNLQNDQGVTALMFVASCEHPGIIRELVEAGANVNLRDIRGRTALMDAAQHDHLEIAAGGATARR